MKKMINKKQSGFTLIELLVVMTIAAILIMATFIPYSHYQNKLKLRQSAKEITQSLYEARNTAINGLISLNSASTFTGNLSVGLYFDKSIPEKPTISLIGYPFSYGTGSNIKVDNPSIDPKIKILKEMKLLPGIQLDKINGDNSKDNVLFLFDAITGNVNTYYFQGINKIDITDPELKLDISFKGSTSSLLQKEIIYYKNTNIVDSN